MLEVRSNNNEKKAIPLSFNHYLTQVVVNAKNSNDTYQVKVCGVKLANLSQDGTYTFYNDFDEGNIIENKMVANGDNVNSLTSVDYTATFESMTLGSAAQLVMPTINIGTESEPTNTTARWYLIPQTVKAWDQANNKDNASVEAKNNGTYLALKVKITANNGALNIYPYAPGYAWMAVPVGIAFEQGKKYNVTLDFFSGTGKGAGYVDPEDPGELDGDPNTYDNGKKIIGGAIKFDATVVEWLNPNEANITISL